MILIENYINEGFFTVNGKDYNDGSVRIEKQRSLSNQVVYSLFSIWEDEYIVNSRKLSEFNDMLINEEIEVIGNEVTLTVTGVYGVTVNGTDGGSATIGDNTNPVGGVIKKIGVNSYIVR